MLRALLWDVDGTIAETERDGHRVAYNRAFEACGIGWRWDAGHYGDLLRVAGGRERLMHDMASRSDAPVLADERRELAALIHRRKNAFYAELVRAGAIVLRPGVREVMEQCRRDGVRMAIVTTSSRCNVDVLLSTLLGSRWSHWFEAVVCGDDTQRKKPDPEVYLQALERLTLGPLEVLAIEDSPGGVAAARAADVPVAVARSLYFAGATIDGAVAIGPGLDRRAGWQPAAAGAAGAVTLDDLREWHCSMELVSQFA